MATSNPLDAIWQWPEAWYASVKVKFYLRSRSQMSVSPWTGGRNVYGPHAQLWICEMTLVENDIDEMLPIQAFFERLGGTRGYVRIGSAIQAQPAWDYEVDDADENWSDESKWSDGRGWSVGHLPSFVTADAAASRGDISLVMRGLPESSERVLRAGDLFEVRRNGIPGLTPSLHRVMGDAKTNADGKMRVEFRPGLRKGIAAGDMIALRRPTSVFGLSEDDQGAPEYGGTTGSLGFTLIERIGGI